MKYLDFHVHFNSGDPAQIADFAAAYRKAECYAAVVGGLRYGGHDFLPNEQVLEWCRKYPYCLIPVAKLDLWETASADEVYRYAEQGFKALKCIYPYYEYDHDLYMPLYEAAQQCGLPVLFHTGNYRPNASDAVFKRPVLKNMDPLNLDRIARSFPELHLVMAHLGTSVWRQQAAEYVKMHPNLYFDLAGNGAWRGVSADDLVALMRPEVNRLDPTFKNYRKLVFGTDAYVDQTRTMEAGLAHYLELCRMLAVPPDVKRAIMGGTAARWLGVELEALD